MTDDKRLTGEDLDQLAKFPYMHPGAEAYKRLISQARRALELEAEVERLRGQEIACMQHGLGFRACGKCFDIQQAQLAEAREALEHYRCKEHSIPHNGSETMDCESCYIGEVARAALAKLEGGRA